MAKEVALSYADLEREAAELIASFTAVEGRTSLSALTGLSARRDSEESRRGNSTPSSASSERVRSPDSDSAGQGAFFSPPVSANVDQRRLSMEQVLRLNAERIASEVRSRHNGGAGPAVQDSANRETKKVLKKLADKWSRYADSFGACKHTVIYSWCYLVINTDTSMYITLIPFTLLPCLCMCVGVGGGGKGTKMLASSACICHCSPYLTLLHRYSLGLAPVTHATLHPS